MATSIDSGKKLLRQAWEYGQRIDQHSRRAKHSPILDLFGSELQALRKKLRERCAQTVLKGPSCAVKAEELLWKKSVYDLVHKCKSQPEAFDPTSALHLSYKNHLTRCIEYYHKLLEKLEEGLGLSPYKSTGSEFETGSLDWLKDVYYSCFIRLGDLARYQSAVGGEGTLALVYYHQAIRLDPHKGMSFNQLAALAGNKNEQLDAVYYYQRSLCSKVPFSVSQANLTRIFEKNKARLEPLERQLSTATEDNIREASRQLLLVRFLRLQHMLESNNGSISSATNEADLDRLSTSILTNLEECLSHDLSLLTDTAAHRVSAALGISPGDQGQPPESLSHDLLLKMCALAMLSSHTLRSLGSTFTPAATVFALSLFSQLLDYCTKRLTIVLTQALNMASIDTSNIDQFLGEGSNMVEILESLKFDISKVSPALDTAPPTASASRGSPKALGELAKEKKLKRVINRRRRRHDESESSGEDVEELSSSDSESDDSAYLLSDALGEDDLDLLDKLSDSSISDDESSQDVSSLEQTPPQAPPTSHTSPKKGRKDIVLAATFNMAQSSQNLKSVPPDPSTAVDKELGQLMARTGHESVVHSVCSLVAGESCLVPLRVFMEWLQSSPIAVTATTSKGSVPNVWSNLALFLNLLPAADQLSCLVDHSPSSAQIALIEDIALRGFPPLSGYHDNLIFDSGEDVTDIKHAILRIGYFCSFGRFISDLRTVPSFSWDRMRDKFIGLVQKQRIDEKRAKQDEIEQEEQAQLQRSRLMNAMAQQRLQHEVASLEVSAKKQLTYFTPYLLPDAASLCSGLHLVKKLLATEKFIFVIAKSTIEALDGMKKGRENYPAREAIKFLEKELKSGHKFIRAQKPEETLTAARKPAKMDQDEWWWDRLIDCGVYYNHTHGSPDHSVVTLLLDNAIIKSTQSGHTHHTLESARQQGLDFDSLIHFNSKWQKQHK